MKTILKILSVLLILFFVYVAANLMIYRNHQKNNAKYIDICAAEKTKIIDIAKTSNEDTNNLTSCASNIENPDSCACKMYNLILPHLVIHKVKVDNKDLKFIRPDQNNAYIVPSVLFEKADAIFGYGIFDNIDFEAGMAELFKKKTYAFDCGIQSAPRSNKYLTFESECIGTDEFILKEFNQVSSEKIHSFGQKLKELNLENKPVFIKMDIAGAEIGVMPDILKYADNIVGMAVVFRMNTNDNIIEFDKIAKEIEKNFVPVVRNMHIYESYEGCKCRYMQSFLSVPVCITYVNKKLITSDTIPFKQSCYEYESYIHPYKIPICLPRFTVNWVVVLDEKIKKMFGRND